MTQPGQKRNYQKELDRLIEGLQREGRIPKLLLHSCCAPCSSYVLEYLSQYFDVTVYYYNPNIFPEAEYEARVKEQERLIREMAAARPVRFLAGSYEPEEFSPLPGAMRRIRREGSGVTAAMNCVWTAPPERPRQGTLIFHDHPIHQSLKECPVAQ